MVAEEPEATTELATLCDHLPLALAITAEKAHRTATLAEVATALRKNRLDCLTTDEADPHTNLRAILSWSYRALAPDTAAMLHTLAHHRPADIDAHTAAALAEVPLPTARRALDQLVAEHLLEQPTADRYELGTLVALYARETPPAGPPHPAR